MAEYDLQKELTLLEDELTKIAVVKELITTEGWQQLGGWMKVRIDDLKEEINSLALDPVNNADAMKYRRWVQDIYRGLISVVETTLGEENNKLVRFQKLRKIAQQIGLISETTD
jgi:hypothetical protein